MEFAQLAAKGLEVEVTLKQDGVVQDISGATTKEIIFSKPSGANVINTASFSTNGTDGKLTYTTTATTEIDQIGRWRFQAHVVAAGVDIYSETGAFRVKANL